MSTNPNSPNRTNSIVGLFRDESRTERALQDLKREGFSETEIGIAAAGRGSAGQQSPFWDRIGKTLNRRVAPDTATVRDSLESSGMSEPQAKYFDAAIARGDILVSVRAFGDRAAQAKSILERAGADFGVGQPGLSVVPRSTAERPTERYEGERAIQ